MSDDISPHPFMSRLMVVSTGSTTGECLRMLVEPVETTFHDVSNNFMSETYSRACPLASPYQYMFYRVKSPPESVKESNLELYILLILASSYFLNHLKKLL